MPRQKKDGRHINYFIDRKIFERLEQYASDKGQQMTTAIERILKEHLDRYDAERLSKGGLTMFCPNCNILTNDSRCPLCGNADVRLPAPDDYCYLAEKEQIWAGTLADVLSQNDIPYVSRNILGAGITAKIGPLMERTRFYVPYAHLENAQTLVRELFSADPQ